MIAEDEPSILESLEFLMRNAGYEIRSVRDGDLAAACLAEFHPHLLLLDVMLPGKSGLEICRLLRADPQQAGTRVLMLTAKGGRIDATIAADSGADEYLAKPFSTRELLARVKALLANGASR